ncbi:MAG TPA: hypothetical protein VFN94_04285 [Nitrospiria bacterium]|jgi:hypothetical protein|nr:hypothetical protein [Nitrospiria bacterium]
MSPEERERIKKLVRELSQCVNSALTDSSDVKDALKDIEEEGYQVDLLFALFTRILRKKDDTPQLEAPPLSADDSAFDEQFLKTLRLNWSNE